MVHLDRTWDVKNAETRCGAARHIRLVGALRCEHAPDDALLARCNAVADEQVRTALSTVTADELTAEHEELGRTLELVLQVMFADLGLELVALSLLSGLPSEMGPTVVGHPAPTKPSRRRESEMQTKILPARGRAPEEAPANRPVRVWKRKY